MARVAVLLRGRESERSWAFWSPVVIRITDAIPKLLYVDNETLLGTRLDKIWQDTTNDGKRLEYNNLMTCSYTQMGLWSSMTTARPCVYLQATG
jgi:hypothetical protein